MIVCPEKMILSRNKTISSSRKIIISRDNMILSRDDTVVSHDNTIITRDQMILWRNDTIALCDYMIVSGDQIVISLALSTDSFRGRRRLPHLRMITRGIVTAIAKKF